MAASKLRRTVMKGKAISKIMGKKVIHKSKEGMSGAARVIPTPSASSALGQMKAVVINLKSRPDRW